MSTHSRRVYSTEGNNNCPSCGKALHKCRCTQTESNSQPVDGILRLRRESKGRGGKQVTVISGFNGDQDITRLLKMIKTRCGTGGTVKGMELEIQGDHRDQVLDILRALHYQVKRSGG